MFGTSPKLNNTGDLFATAVNTGQHLCPVGIAIFAILEPAKNGSWIGFICKEFSRLKACIKRNKKNVGETAIF